MLLDASHPDAVAAGADDAAESSEIVFQELEKLLHACVDCRSGSS